MDSWFFNKIAGAVLAAMLIAFGAGTMAEILIGHGDKKAKPGYELPVTAAVSGAATAAAAPAKFDYVKFAPLLKSGSAENGRNVFAQCRACHSVDKGGRVLQGPNLWNSVGQKIGGNAEFTRYSPALKGKAGNWTYETLAAYLTNPAAAIPGNQMGFQGVKSESDLADLIAYLRTLADSPVALPN